MFFNLIRLAVLGVTMVSASSALSGCNANSMGSVPVPGKPTVDQPRVSEVEVETARGDLTSAFVELEEDLTLHAVIGGELHTFTAPVSRDFSVAGEFQEMSSSGGVYAYLHCLNESCSRSEITLEREGEEAIVEAVITRASVSQDGSDDRCAISFHSEESDRSDSEFPGLTSRVTRLLSFTAAEISSVHVHPWSSESFSELTVQLSSVGEEALLLSTLGVAEGEMYVVRTTEEFSADRITYEQSHSGSSVSAIDFELSESVPEAELEAGHRSADVSRRRECVSLEFHIVAESERERRERRGNRRDRDHGEDNESWQGNGGKGAPSKSGDQAKDKAAPNDKPKPGK